MSLENIVAKLIQKEAFQNRFTNLLIHSVQAQFPAIETNNINSPEIEWSYLLTCASILAKSQDAKALDIAFRICQTCVCENSLSDAYKNAAASIFNLLTNSSAISLAQKRNFISHDYLSRIPFEYALDVKRKQFTNTIIDGDNFIFLNDFQKDVYSAYNETKCLSISAPTSAGKSFILLHIIKEAIIDNPLVKIAYIVPTRALIQQVEFDIRNILHSNEIIADVSSIPVKPDNWDKCPCVLIFTQERLQWILSETKNISFDLIFVDEAQKIGDGARGILLQQVLQEASRNDNTRFVFASPMSDNPSALLKVINYTDSLSADSKQVVSEIVTVNQNLIWVSQVGTSTQEWHLDLLSNDSKIDIGNIKTSRITAKSHRLPILAYRLAGDQKGNLIYVNGAAEAETIALQLESLILNDNQAFIPSEKIDNLIKLIKKTIHPNYVLVETLKAGVAFHYGNMPLAIRNNIEELFKEGEISFLVCTSTLVEGVNLPAKSIFLRGPQKGRNNPMNEMDFWNLAGRAGRQGQEFQGNIVCVDVTDSSAWKTDIPTTRKKYMIQGTVDKVVATKRQALVSYILSDDKTINVDNTLDYSYTYFLAQHFTYGRIIESPLVGLYGKDICQTLDSALDTSLAKIELPESLLSKNHGVNPLAQQRLFEYFQSSQKSPNELIPPFPEEADATEKYMHIVGRISKHITNESGKLNMSRAILVTDWMRGYGLARIISDNIEWCKKHKPDKKLQAIIRDTMKDIEEYARFRFLKYTTCYIDILKYYFATSGNLEAIDNIPKINLWLEFGASQTTQISLMSMGFTRTAALEISEIIIVEDLDKKKCQTWLLRSDLKALDFSQNTLTEIEKILQLQ